MASKKLVVLSGLYLNETSLSGEGKGSDHKLSVVSLAVSHSKWEGDTGGVVWGTPGVVSKGWGYTAPSAYARI